MTNLGHIENFLGIEFLKTDKGQFKHQKRCAIGIQKKFKMEQCNVVITPANPRLKRSKEDNEKVFDPTQYRILF